MNKVAFYKEEILKIAKDKYDTHLLSTRNAYEEYDNIGKAFKRLGIHLGAGTAGGAGLGALIGALKKNPKAGAAIGGLAGLLGGSISSDVAQMRSDFKAADKRYEGNKGARRLAKVFGPAVGDMKMRKDMKKEAAEKEDPNKTKFVKDRLVPMLKNVGGNIGGGLVGLGVGALATKGKSDIAKRLGRSTGGAAGYFGVNAHRLNKLHEKEFGEKAPVGRHAASIGHKFLPTFGLTGTPEAIIKAKKRKLSKKKED